MPHHRLIPVGLGTRFAALQVDYVVIMFVIIVPITTFMPDLMIVESGLFKVIIGFWLLYSWVAGRFFGGTIGQHILGYKIIEAQGERPKYTLRLIFGFLALCLSVFTWWWNYHIKDGIYWWDRASNTRAVPLRYIHKA